MKESPPLVSPEMSSRSICTKVLNAVLLYDSQAQGILQLLGGPEAVSSAIRQHNVLLAAHGPYTADGAGRLLGMPVTCISQDFRTFDGLVTALERHFAGAAGK